MLTTKNYFLLLPLFAFMNADAQVNDLGFINRSSVTWAADVSASYKFNNPNLNLGLRNKLTTGKLKVFIPGQNDVDQKASAEDVRQRVSPDRTIAMADADGNVTGTIMEADDPLFSSLYFNEKTNSTILLKQLLYLRNGRLKIYIPTAAPAYTVVTSWGEELGQAPAFNTAANKCLKIPRFRSRMFSYDTVSRIKVNLEVGQEVRMLKQLYSHNLVQALWPNLDNKKYHYFIGDSKSPVQLEAIDMGIINGGTGVQIPVFDASGNIGGYTPAPPIPLDISLFTQADIITIIYFDPKKNRFYSKPQRMILYARRWINASWEKEASPVLTITMN